MKLTLFMAMSVNGYIAEKDGGEDFLSHQNWESLTDLVNEYGNLIWGHGTYAALEKWNESFGLNSFPDAKKIIVSRDASIQIRDGYAQASSPAEALKMLEDAGFQKALLSGGSHLNSAFIKEGLVDEVLLNIEPALLGKGIPVFAQEDFQATLSLVETKNIGEIVQLRYTVNK